MAKHVVATKGEKTNIGHGGSMKSLIKYKCRISKCDIMDKDGGRKFRDKRRQWLDWLKGKDPHAILTQIYDMLWNYALFCTINELLQVSEKRPIKRVGFNNDVMLLFRAGFFTIQAATIRRIIERPKRGKKGRIIHGLKVISIGRILEDMKDNIHLITRENYVCYDGLPYDPSRSTDSERLHKVFDRLSNVGPSCRNRHDLIDMDKFSWFDQQIGKCEDIKVFVDKFIAHGADPATRRGRRGLSLKRLKECHRLIYRVTTRISKDLLDASSLGGLPVPQYDHLANLEKTWATPQRLRRAAEKWDEYAREVAAWDYPQRPLWLQRRRP